MELVSFGADQQIKIIQKIGIEYGTRCVRSNENLSETVLLFKV